MSSPVFAPDSFPRAAPAAAGGLFPATAGGLRLGLGTAPLGNLFTPVAEAEAQAVFAQALADGSLFASDHQKATALTQRSAEIEDALMQALERWESLGARA